jgi:hypothetical protein
VTDVPIIVAILAGLAFGGFRRGRLRALARTRVRRPEFLAIALGCILFVDATGAGPSGSIALVGLMGGLAFAVTNVHLAGMAVIAVGIMANLLPVGLNGAMPVRGEALVEAEMVTADELERVTLPGAREFQTDATILPALGDTYPVRFTGQAVSLGDIIMMVGLADVVANLMLQRRRRRLPPSAMPSLAAFGWHETPDGLDLRDIEIRHPDLIDLRDDLEAAREDEPQPV